MTLLVIPYRAFPSHSHDKEVDAEALTAQNRIHRWLSSRMGWSV